MYSATEQLLKWLGAKGYEAHTYPPKNAPSRFVTVERTGGSVENLVDYPTMAIQTWAQSQAEAEEMALAIRDALVYELPHGYYSMRVNAGPYPYWDEDTGAARYQTVYNCTTILTE